MELEWDNESGEGKVKITKEFVISHRIVQLDALQDWIYELTDLYDTLLGEQFIGEENESKKKQKVRHGQAKTQ
jgi:hypothetical protein